MSELAGVKRHSVRSQSIEDYLKAVYELTQDAERASTNALAKALDIAPASVTGMLQKLHDLR